ncbi:MAG: ubiquinone/menaquinone biosynthesis methyltransferase [Alphaproteobacteria bacterium]|nr:ubiquinone/menaquinone biosynthesis methyltransferase [Alphaproteobacteria bacterium]
MDEDKVSFGFEDVSRDEKSRRVKGVFASVASKYDLMNDLMSAGVHRVWKANLIAKLNPQPGETLIDVAGGTGDVARAFHRRASEVAKRRNATHDALAIVADINEAMLVAGRKPGEDHLPRVACDAARLPFRDRCCDALTISFGIRNVVEMDAALREFRRVLKPGGRFACLEFSHMTHSLLQDIYDRYSFNVIPRIGEIVTGDKASYQYLVESIRRFPDQETFAARIRDAGFGQVGYENYSGGVAALHTGWAV